MEEKYLELEIQIYKVIDLLQKRLEEDPNKPILNTLFDRYNKAKNILSNNGDTNKIIIKGGCRAYLDAFSDYMNPLLIEMDKAEKLLSEICK